MPRRKRSSVDRPWHAAVVAVILVLFMADRLLAGEESSPPDDEAASDLRQASEQALAGIELLAPDADMEWDPVDRVPQPVLQFSDPTRAHEHGTVWLWGATARPRACLELYQNATRDWIYVFHNLSDGPLEARRHGTAWWKPKEATVALKAVPAAPVPAEFEAVRLRQMKAIARRFRAHEFWDPDNSRFELRLLSQPLHRYADAAAGLLDGGFFVFANGTNPEIVLLIEARADPDGRARWQYALARTGHAEMHMAFDADEVWTASRVASPAPDEPYTLFFVPAVAP